MNKEELIGKLQMTYVGDKNALYELVGYYDGLKQGIEQLQQENKQLKERIDKAIEYITNKSILSCKGLDLNLCDNQIEELLEILKGE